MEIMFQILVLCILLPTQARPAKGPDFNGTWVLYQLAEAVNPYIEAIGQDLFRTEKTLIVEQTVGEIRVSRRGSSSQGQPIVKDANYSLLGGSKSGATLHGSTLTIKRAVEAAVGNSTEKMNGEEEWSFQDNKETLLISLFVHSSKVTQSFGLYYKRARANQGKTQR